MNAFAKCQLADL